MEIISKCLLRVHPDFNKLIISLRTAIGAKEDLVLDKTQTSYSDCLDSLRLAAFGISSIIQG
jgi:hypothetical protein